MRNFIKNISAIVMAFVLMCGTFVIAGSNAVYADGENTITVVFHYVRADKDYSNYYIKAFQPSDSNGRQGELTVLDSESSYEYTFAKNLEVDDSVNFAVMLKSTGEADYQEIVDITTVNSGTVNVYIDGDAKSYTTDIAVDVVDDVSEPETVLEDDFSDDVTVVTEKADVPDDPNADYSVKTYMVVLIDVVFFVALGGIAFVVSSKKKNAFM